MNISSATLVYFSPTQTTKKVVEGVARGVRVDTVEHLDLTPPQAKTRECEEMNDGLAIIGAPVYGGRIPGDVAHRLRCLKGNDTPAVVIVVYGNRAYGDALLELRDLIAEMGFRLVAGGAFIGEHSFSNDSTPIAVGRPDAKDIEKAVEFGRVIRGKMGEIHNLDEVLPLQVPGNLPYEERGKASKTSPVTQEALCSKCGRCAAICPTAAVVLRETVITDQDVCILCCACVKNCPAGARVMRDAGVRRLAEWLTRNCRERKEPEVYV
jgi:ferredoxin